MNNTLIVTGCAGFIGGTFTFKALSKGYKVIGVDSFINSNPSIVNKIAQKFPEKFIFIEEDLAKSTNQLEQNINDIDFDAVIHFAGLKAVGESEHKPLKYWENNLISSTNLLSLMKAHKVKKFIFSSSATVYGDSDVQPILESNNIQSTSAYGSTKIAIEQLLKDCARAGLVDVISLRYFNPVGAHQEMIIHEDPYDMPNNLMPRIIRVALNLDQKLQIYGNDYDTRDGTGERDYIHIDDLVDGHFKALEYIKDLKGFEAFNLGTGQSITVKEIISCFEEVNGIQISHEFSDRRSGDVAKCFADPSKAANLLGWSTQKSLEDMCLDSWRAVKKI